MDTKKTEKRKNGRTKKEGGEKTRWVTLGTHEKEEKNLGSSSKSSALSRGLTILFLDNDFGCDFTGVAVCRTIGVLSGSSRSSSRSSRGSSSIVSCRDRRSPRPV